MNPFSAVIVLIVSFSLGCSDDFTPYSQLDRLRVLAIKSDPPNPRPNEPARFTALVFAPEGNTVTRQWSWCPVAAPANESYQCPVSAAVASLVLDQPVESFDLGMDEDAVFISPLPPEKATELCTLGIRSSNYSGAPDCDDGFPVTMVLDVASGTQSLRAGFRFFLPTNAQAEFNTNPEILELLLNGVALSQLPMTSMGVVPGAPIPINLVLATDAVESRPVPPTEVGSGRRLERITLSWFTNAGKMDKDRTVFIDGVSSLEEVTRNTWTAPEVASWPTGGVRFYVVVRDDRGGVGWIEKLVQLEKQP